jgi:hypothetical protein
VGRVLVFEVGDNNTTSSPPSPLLMSLLSDTDNSTNSGLVPVLLDLDMSNPNYNFPLAGHSTTAPKTE